MISTVPVLHASCNRKYKKYRREQPKNILPVCAKYSRILPGGSRSSYFPWFRCTAHTWTGYLFFLMGVVVVAQAVNILVTWPGCDLIMSQVQLLQGRRKP